MRFTCRITAVITLFALAAFATSPAGTWRAKITTRNGSSFYNVFHFRVRGHVLTGTVASGDYPPLPISHGRVAGARVAFDVVQHAEDHAFTMKYTGTLHGGRLQLTLTFPLGGHQVQMVARRKP